MRSCWKTCDDLLYGFELTRWSLFRSVHGYMRVGRIWDADGSGMVWKLKLDFTIFAVSCIFDKRTLISSCVWPTLPVYRRRPLTSEWIQPALAFSSISPSVLSSPDAASYSPLD